MGLNRYHVLLLPGYEDSLLEDIFVDLITVVRVHVTHQLLLGIPPLQLRPFMCDSIVLDEQNGSLGGHLLVIASDDNVDFFYAVVCRSCFSRHICQKSRDGCPYCS